MAEIVDDEYAVSIHAPVKGATYTKKQQRKIQRRFNPRSREGSDILLLMLLLT